MKSYRFSWVGITFFVILIVFMITLGYKKVESSSYPDMWSRYAGFVNQGLIFLIGPAKGETRDDPTGIDGD